MIEERTKANVRVLKLAYGGLLVALLLGGWYAGQFHYKKVDGTPPGEKWRHTTMSVPEMADLLGLKSGTAYDLVKRGYFETTLIDRRIRIITSSFEAWYQKQTHYVKISERSNENGIYREA